MTEIVAAITTQAGTLITNVGLCVVAGIGVGALILGARRGWNAFKSMSK